MEVVLRCEDYVLTVVDFTMLYVVWLLFHCGVTRRLDIRKENLVRLSGDVRVVEVLSCTSVNTYNRLQNSPCRIFAYSSTREQSNKRWNEAENRGQDWGETTAIGGSAKDVLYWHRESTLLFVNCNQNAKLIVVRDLF